MAGIDVVRGIGYQQAQGVLAALDVLMDESLGSLRIEGRDDIVDVEVLSTDGALREGRQYKTRSDPYTWAKAELLGVLRRWAALPDAEGACFRFITDGPLGPSGEAVRDALRAAREGDTAALAALLGSTVDDPVCRILGDADVVVEAAGAGALLTRAEREVASILPSPRTVADALEEAEKAVNGLFRLLVDRGGQADAAARLVTRAEIAAVLGVPLDVGRADLWGDEQRQEYVTAAAQMDVPAPIVPARLMTSAVAPALRRIMPPNEVESPAASVPAVTLLEGSGAMLLVGGTGIGKSTAVTMLRKDAAITGHIVVVAHAESYLPGRIAALVADGIGAVMARGVPAAVTRRLLSDTRATIVIDGASEIPPLERDALREDLRRVLAVPHARIVLVGRDLAVLRSLLPTHAAPEVFELTPLDRDEQWSLVRQALALAGRPGNDDAVHHVVAVIEDRLGDARGNRLLFVMALTLIVTGVTLTSRGELYQQFIGGLAGRVGALDMSAVTTVLGAVFGELLDDGRRYADAFEWRERVLRVTQGLAANGLRLDGDLIDAEARKAGLIVSLGVTQTITAMHDSIADYLAAAAHTLRISPLPEVLQASDTQRIRFVADLTGVEQGLATRVARNLPWLAIQLVERDKAGFGDDAPALIAALVSEMWGGPPLQVNLWRDEVGRIIACLGADASTGWISAEVGRAMLVSNGAIVVTGGPLAAAVASWGELIRRELRACRDIPPSLPRTPEQAVSALSDYVAATTEEVRRLAPLVVAAPHLPMLLDHIGPLGLTAQVFSAEQSPYGAHLPLRYLASPDIEISVATQLADEFGREWGRTSVEAMMRRSPIDEAREQLRRAINTLVGRPWL